jgi:hypothetical protein
MALRYKILYQYCSQWEYLLKTVFRFKIGPIFCQGGLLTQPHIRLKRVQNCHRDRRAICTQRIELNFLLNMISLLVYYEMVRCSPVHVFPNTVSGDGGLCSYWALRG